VAPSLLGRAVHSLEEIADLASSWKASRFAVAGAETALWDLLGQARHATIAELLGAPDLRIDLGVESGLAVGLYSSIVELIKTIEAHLTAGYRRVKIKIQPGQDLELVRAVRLHFGDVELMVDANGAYSGSDIDIFRELDQYDLLMFEQPLAAHDPSDLEPSFRWFVDDYTVPLIDFAAPGIIEVPTRPSLGYHVDPVKVRRYQAQQQEFTTKTIA